MIGVAVGTYGDKDYWGPLAKRALSSVHSQTLECEYQWVHADALHEARNKAARMLIKRGCDWLVFLDADDELDAHFVEVMSRQYVTDKWTALYPSVLHVVDGIEDVSTWINPPKDLLKQNFVTIGTMHSTEVFSTIGGFADWPILEDWEYWQRAYIAGAKFVPVAQAIYRVGVDTYRVARNNQLSDSDAARVANDIRALGSYRYQQKQRT